MRTSLPVALLFVAALAACGRSNHEAVSQSGEAKLDIAAESPASEPAPAQQGGAPVEVALPQIAYTYSYTFRLRSDAVTSIQERHAKMCEALGPARCRVVDLKRSAGSGDYVTGSLTLQVAAPIAGRFGEELVANAAAVEGETIDRGIAAEDLSKQIIDTSARIKTKEILVERLTKLLETRSGNIAQAVEAERAINGAQEELEQARAWLAEMRGRVAMSTFQIEYQSGAPLGGGFSDPIREAFAGVGEMTGRNVAIAITLVAAILPWALLLALTLGLYRRFRKPREAEDDVADAEA
ncbi:DUF4349 domain-containing protein [Allosphingosinicella humi]